MTSILIPVSPGEVLDKIGILRLKVARIGDAAKLANITRELGHLETAAQEALPDSAALDDLAARLDRVNARLWDVEDALRDHEARGDFGPGFVALARSVYTLNDERAGLKRAINDLLGASIVEEKSYGGSE
jgi:hypothetical protein